MLTAVVVLTIINTLILIGTVQTLTQKIDETKQRIDQIWDDYMDDTIDLLLEEDDEQ